MSEVEDFIAVVVLLCGGGGGGGGVDPKGWVYCSLFYFLWMCGCWSERLRSSLLWLFYFLGGCWCWFERLRSFLLWLWYFLWVGVLIQKVEEFIALVLLSVWLCVDPKGWGVHCSGCFTFCVGVDLKGWVHCCDYFLWVCVGLKGWGVHCSDFTFYRCVLIQKVEFIACCFTFCGWVLIWKVEEFIALAVLLSVWVLIWKVEFIAVITFCGCVLGRKVEEFIALILLSIGVCWSKRLSLLLVVLLSVGGCWSKRLRSSLLWLTPSCNCLPGRRRWQTATMTAPSISWLTSRKSCMWECVCIM